MLSKILKNSLENTSAGVSFLIKVETRDLKPATLLKKDTPAQLVSLEVSKTYKNTPFKNSSEVLLLDILEY